MAKKSTIPARLVLRDKTFWLNLGMVLVATCWIPLVSLEVTDAAGAVQRHQVPVYRCYMALASEPSAIAAIAVVIHLTVCLAISFVMRRWMLQAKAGD